MPIGLIERGFGVMTAGVAREPYAIHYPKPRYGLCDSTRLGCMARAFGGLLGDLSMSRGWCCPLWASEPRERVLSLALGGDLRDGGGAYHPAHLLTDWAPSHCAALSAYSGLHIGDRCDDFKSQPTFGAGTAYGHLTDGDDRGVLEVKPLHILCV